MEILLSLSIGLAYLMLFGVLISTFIGICLHQQALCKHIRKRIGLLNDEKRRPQQKKLLIDIIQFDNSAKENFAQSADVFSIFILILLISYMIVLSTGIFQLDLVNNFIEKQLFHLQNDF